MDEVPTVRVDPLTPKCDNWCEFPVSDRPNAVAKWLKTDDAKQGNAQNEALTQLHAVCSMSLKVPC